MAMPNIYNYLGFLKLNNEEDGLNYLPGDYESYKSSSSKSSDEYFNDVDDEPIEDTEEDTTSSVCSDESHDNNIEEASIIEKARRSKHGDLTGKKIGMLTVKCIDMERSIRERRIYYICECECKNVRSIRADNLVNGNTSSCGCSKIQDLTGRKFGKLTVLHMDEERSIQMHRTYWICKCKCGNVKSIPAKTLLNKTCKSCGCNISSNRYDLSGEFGIGFTRNDTIFFFDKEDFPLISQYMWTNNPEGYIIAYYNDDDGNKKHVLMHRLVMGVTEPDVFVDHIHHNHADNRKSELRVVSRAENNMNRRVSKINTSGYTGVAYDLRSKKWRASIAVNGERIGLGYYDNKEDAAKARKEAEKKYFGEFQYRGTTSTDQILQKTDSTPNPELYTKAAAV